ncbi:MAG: hypothetical protein J6J36_00480 [Clostridia bacterium]|nr:hypothetical protein [Clostridia bacterium]
MSDFEINMIRDEELKKRLKELVDRIPNLSNWKLRDSIEFYTQLKDRTNKDTDNDLFTAYKLYVKYLEKELRNRE